MYKLFRVFFILSAVLCMAQSPCSGELVVFLHKTGKKIKYDDCNKWKGVHDKFPAYECFGKDAKPTKFEPEPDWEEADISGTCFEWNDNYKIVLQIVGKKTKIKSYFYPGKKRKLVLFDPDKDPDKKWKPLNKSDCKELRKKRKSIEVPKGISEIFD
ncbi:MAG: hypothetical protein GY795_01615 [Desulfobacterales bacterium]|nr:hypothetical protein [Desulfobacterales bacterium]